ncbi:hypothetical protein H311_00701 [Anncaliia algerae PRA109]|nr:hypothetical protein H311_00701 [Anncaliia algerae PRA109]
MFSLFILFTLLSPPIILYSSKLLYYNWGFHFGIMDHSYDPTWIFRIFEIISKRVYLEVVPRRDGAILYYILYKIVIRTRVFPDFLRDYNIIKQNFEVSFVNHRLSFVDLNYSNIHTNKSKIEENP